MASKLNVEFNFSSFMDVLIKYSILPSSEVILFVSNKKASTTSLPDN